MYYSDKELRDIGFEHVGKNNKISKLSKFYSIEGSKLGDNNRIDDFSLLKGKVIIENYVHIAAFCLFSGVGGKIEINSYCGFSSHCSVWTASEDFINPTLTSPSINKHYSKFKTGNIYFDESVKVGNSCCFLPGIKIGFGVSISANTMINNSVKDGAVIGPKNRTFKIFGYRDINSIKKLKFQFENQSDS